MLYQIYVSSEAVSTSDASEAVAMYQHMVDAGAHPSVWRDGKFIVQVSRCMKCGAPVLLTREDANGWLGAWGEDLENVLCKSCLDRILDAEQAAYDEKESWDREVEIMLFNAAHTEQ